MKQILVVIIALLSASFMAHADVTVITNVENKTEITDKDIKKIFTGKKSKFSDDVEVKIANNISKKGQQSEFNVKFLNKRDAQVRSLWSRLIFTGQATSLIELGSDSEIIKFVKANRGSIGVIDSGSVTKHVRSVKTK